MEHLITLAFLNNGAKRIRNLATHEILYETFDLNEAKKVAESEAQKLGSTGYTWISESIDRWLVTKNQEE